MLFTMRDSTTSTVSSTQPQYRKAAVRLGGSADQIVGIDVPQGVQEEHFDYVRSQSPTDLTIYLPDGRTTRICIRYTSLGVTYGTVTDIDLLPLLESVTSTEAMVQVRPLMKQLGFTPDERMREVMENWPQKDVPGFDPMNRPGWDPAKYRAAMHLPDDLWFCVEIRPSTDGGWFIAISISITGDTRRQIMGLPSTQPSTKPASRSTR